MIQSNISYTLLLGIKIYILVVEIAVGQRTLLD